MSDIPPFPPTGFEVKLEYPMLAFIYGICPVFVVINGTKIQARWGTQFFPAEPGRYQIQCFLRYLITPQAGLNGMEGDLYPGQIVRITWTAPHIVFLKGPMRWEQIRTVVALPERGKEKQPMHWQSLAYAVACVVVPVLWGLLVVWASNAVERLLQKRRNANSPQSQEERFPPIDYHI